MKLTEPLVGFAVANDEAEHVTLTTCGYEPAFEPVKETDALSVESVRAQLDAAGIAYDGRMGLAKLQALLP